MATPTSLVNAINEDPDRFAKYLDTDAIAKAKNPFEEFKRQMQKEFGGSVTGLNLYQHFKDSYKLQNTLFKSKTIQSKLPDYARGSYKKKEFNRLREKYNRRTTKNPIQTGVYAVNKTVKVSKDYTRKIGGIVKTITSYAKTKPRVFNSQQVDFLSRRISQPPKEVTRLFNITFKTNRTVSSVKTKMSRLR